MLSYKNKTTLFLNSLRLFILSVFYQLEEKIISKKMEQMLLEYSPNLLSEPLKWCYSLTPLLFYIWWCFLLGITVLEWFFSLRIFWKSYVKVVKNIWLFLSCSELYHTKLQTSYLQCISFWVLISAVTFTAIMLCQTCVLIKSVK